MRLLVVEDDAGIAAFLQEGLRKAGYEVDHATDGLQGLNLATGQAYAVMIVDLMLPGLDGLSLIKRLRHLRVMSPVLILSAKQSVDDRVNGLKIGGDDYLTKPFAFSELVARIQALVRRTTGAPEITRMKVGPVEVDLLKHEVKIGEKRLDLQPREFSLLEYLMRNAGKVVSKTMIMENVWDYNFDPETNVVESRICRLRDKIEKFCAAKLIHTIRGVGYVFREDS